jgi:hypothetical protein
MNAGYNLAGVPEKIVEICRKIVSADLTILAPG